jgi:hypothetical protein
MVGEASFEFQCYAIGLTVFMIYLHRRIFIEDRAVVPTAAAWLLWVLGVFISLFAVLTVMAS